MKGGGGVCVCGVKIVTKKLFKRDTQRNILHCVQAIHHVHH